jgi:hypothetical protein
VLILDLNQAGLKNLRGRLRLDQENNSRTFHFEVSAKREPRDIALPSVWFTSRRPASRMGSRGRILIAPAIIPGHVGERGIPTCPPQRRTDAAPASACDQHGRVACLNIPNECAVK